MRDALVAALSACATSRPSRYRTRRFLMGLSSDELQFLAEYVGSRSLGVAEACACAYSSHGASCAGWQQSRDREHKLILLWEFLGRSGMQPVTQGTSLWNLGAGAF